MNLVVTGGAGNVGRAVVRKLARAGHILTVLDRHVGNEVAGVAYHRTDVADIKGLKGHFSGVDALIHLAAIAHPALASGPAIFQVNASGTFNVFQAAAEAGIKRVVAASSNAALGYTFGIKEFDLQYFPVDEAHPPFTTDAYAFSKQVLEEIAAYFWRRYEVSSVCLRFPLVYESESLERDKRSLEADREVYEALLRSTPEERERRLGNIRARVTSLRETAPWERAMLNEALTGPDAALIWNRLLLWSRLDMRDAVDAVARGVIADYRGSHVLFISQAHNHPGVDASALAHAFFPHVLERKRQLSGSESLISIQRAGEVIGFVPRHSFGCA